MHLLYIYTTQWRHNPSNPSNILYIYIHNIYILYLIYSITAYMCLLKHHDRLQGTSWFRRSQWTFVWNILRSDKMGYQEISCEWPLYPPKEQLRQSRVNTHDKVFNVDSQGTPGMVSSVGAHTERGVWASSASLPSEACMVYIFFQIGWDLI